MKDIIVSGYRIKIRFPNKCPRCHHSIAPNYLSYVEVDSSSDVSFQ